MIFSYAAEGVIFSNALSIGTLEMNQKYEDILSSTGEKIGEVYSFSQFLEINYQYIKDRGFGSYIGPGDVSLKDGLDHWFLSYLSIGYGGRWVTINGQIYLQTTDYVSGADGYNRLPEDAALTIDKKLVREHYADYLSQNGYEQTEGGTGYQKRQDDIFTSALNFIGSIPSYFGTLADLLTFSVKDHSGANVFPGPVQFIILIFMVPLWILLIIGILPYIISIIEALGKLLDAFTPFT